MYACTWPLSGKVGSSASRPERRALQVATCKVQVRISEKHVRSQRVRRGRRAEPFRPGGNRLFVYIKTINSALTFVAVHGLSNRDRRLSTC